MVLLFSLAWRTLVLMSPIALQRETSGLCSVYRVQPDLLGVFNQKLGSFLRLFCFRVLLFILPLVISRLTLPSPSFGFLILRSLLLRLLALPLEMIMAEQTYFIFFLIQPTYIHGTCTCTTVHDDYPTCRHNAMPKKHCLSFLRVFACGLLLLL